MIEEFSVGNFRSFKDIQTLNMTAAKIKSAKSELDSDNVIADGKRHLLKSKVIYGANASGKSNIVKALKVFVGVAANNLKDDEVLKGIEPFALCTDTEHEPSFFQLIFRHQGIRYRYGFTATKTAIVSEWLYGTPGQRELIYFIREGQAVKKTNPTYFEDGVQFISIRSKGGRTEEDKDHGLFRSNALFLSVIASVMGGVAELLLKTIRSIVIIDGSEKSALTLYANFDGEAQEQAQRFLQYADTGIKSVEAREASRDYFPEDFPEELISGLVESKPKVLYSYHAKFDGEGQRVGDHPFAFDKAESEGTKKMLNLGRPILQAIGKGGALVIDELDARFHSLLSKKIVSLFNSPENKLAQLVAVSHDTNLLSNDLLRRDQIDFVEKDDYGASQLYTLVEFKGVRNTDSFERDYMQGKYGAVPFLGDWSDLIEND